MVKVRLKRKTNHLARIITVSLVYLRLERLRVLMFNKRSPKRQAKFRSIKKQHSSEIRSHTVRILLC